MVYFSTQLLATLYIKSPTVENGDAHKNTNSRARTPCYPHSMPRQTRIDAPGAHQEGRQMGNFEMDLGPEFGG